MERAPIQTVLKLKERAPVQVKRTSKFHYAKLENSERLQRLLAVLQRGGWWSTRELVKEADVMAVSTAINELRMNNIAIDTRARGGHYEYRIAG